MEVKSVLEKRRKVLIVLGGLNRGGAETMVMNYYRHMDREKVQFDFVVHSAHIGAYEDEIKSLGGHIYHIPRFKVYNLFAYLTAWKDLLTAHPEYRIIHAHMASTACLFIPIAKRNGIKTIVHAHNSRVTGPLLKRILEKVSFYPLKYMADYFFACSDEAGIFKFGKNILKNPHYHIWYNAIDMSQFTYSKEKRKEIRDKLLLTDDNILIGNVGRITPPKNHKFILEVFNQFVKKYPKAKLVLIGEGELEQKLKQRIKELRLEESVILTGSINNVSDYLSAMDVFLFPSLFEGLGMAVVEAQVSSLYCLASTEVPQAAKISDNIDFLPLDASVETWCQKLATAPKIDRETFRLQNDDYDIEKAAKKAEEFYLSL